MKKAVLVIAVAMLAFAMLATPVLAIGPYRAEEVGNNPNLYFRNGGLGNRKGNAGGSNVWALGVGEYWVRWKWMEPADAKGVMNSAVMVTNMTQLTWVITSDYENMWIYLSGDGGSNPYQFQFPPVGPYAYLNPLGKHGMCYWLFFFAFGSVEAAILAATSFPNGALWMHNNIQD